MATSHNADRVVRHIGDYFLSGEMDKALGVALIGVEETSDYARLANTLGPETSIDNQMVSLGSAMRFNERLLGCADRSGAGRFFDEGQCGWIETSGIWLDRGATADNQGFDASGWEISAGGQFDLDNGWFVGGSLAYGEVNLGMRNSDASSDGSQFQIGISAKRRIDNFEFAGSLSTGWGNYDIDRQSLPGYASSGNQQIRTTAAQLRAAMVLQRGAWVVRPRVGIRATNLSADSFDESGGGALAVSMNGSSKTYYDVQPAIDFIGEFGTRDGMLVRPKLTLGLTQLLGDTNVTDSGRLRDAPGTVASFSGSTELDRTRFDFAAGVDVFARESMAVRAEIAGSYSAHSTDYGASLKFEMSF
jgi:outer membrane autotransporter protein